MSSKLSELRGRLQRLQRRLLLRRVLRVASWLGIIVLLSGWILFSLDFSLRWSWWARVVQLIAWTGSLTYVFRRWIWPQLAVREDLEDVAIAVEQQHHLDGDLIAALQFDAAAESPRFGSPRLTNAVIDYVADFSRQLDVFDGFADPRAARWFIGTTVVALLTLACGGLYPTHVGTFWNRLWLGNARYPTNTRIVSLDVNGQRVAVQPRSARVRVPQGTPIVVGVDCAGDLPVAGEARLLPLNKTEPATRALVREDAANNNAASTASYRTELPTATESFRLEVALGDAELDPLLIEVAQLPLVELTWEVTPPSYAGSVAEPATHQRQLAVLEGSRLQPIVTCRNKQLRSVALTIGEETLTLQRQASAPSTVGDRSTPHSATAPADMWICSPPASRMTDFRETSFYRLHVEDEDGLTMTPPIEGQIRLRPDRLPRVAATVLIRQVLPTATPKIAYGAVDDFGIAKLAVRLEVTRADGTKQTHHRELPLPADATNFPRTVKGESAIELSSLQLVKGDEVAVIIEAWDHRGSLPSQQGQSEAIRLQVTDRQGILASLLEADQQSAQQLDAIIQRELGIEGKSR